MAVERSGKVLGYRRKRLRNGRYLQIVLLDQPGPRGGMTEGYVLTRRTPERPAATPPPTPTRRRRVVLRRKGVS